MRRIGSNTTAERLFVWGLRCIDDLILRDRCLVTEVLPLIGTR